MIQMRIYQPPKLMMITNDVAQIKRNNYTPPPPCSCSQCVRAGAWWSHQCRCQCQRDGSCPLEFKRVSMRRLEEGKGVKISLESFLFFFSFLVSPWTNFSSLIWYDMIELLSGSSYAESDQHNWQIHWGLTGLVVRWMLWKQAKSAMKFMGIHIVCLFLNIGNKTQ